MDSAAPGDAGHGHAPTAPRADPVALDVFVIGRSPRPDLQAEIEAAAPGLRPRLTGALDGLSRDEIAALAPRDGADTLFTLLPGDVILAADALTGATPGSGIFRGADLPRGLEDEFDCACAVSDR